MAENIVTLHPAPVKRPLTAAERGKAFRERQKNKTAANPAQPTEKADTFANGERAERERPNAGIPVPERPNVRRERSGLPPPPPFAILEKSTAELVAACQRGIEAARCLFRSEIKPLG